MKKFIINKESTIKKCMSMMNRNGKGICFVENKKKIIGIVTNGDIRRYFLKRDINLNLKVEKITNRNFDFVKKNFHQKEVISFFKKDKFDILPVLSKGKLIKIIEKKSSLNLHGNNLREIPVVVMIGGFGKRMRPFTNFLPKALIPVNGIPVINIILKNFFDYGFEKFFFITHYKSEIVKALLKNEKKITFLNEKKPLGTAGGIYLIKKFNYKNIIVTNCDTIINYDYNKIYDYHLKNKCDITIISSLNRVSIPYGVCKVDKSFNLKKIDEKPTYNNLVNIGSYILSSTIFRLIKKETKLDMDQLLKIAIKNKRKIKVYCINNGQWSDVGEWSSYRNYVKKIKN